MIKTINPFKRSVYANTFAFHDAIANYTNIVELFEYIVNICNDLGLEPTHMNLTTDFQKHRTVKTYKREKNVY
jgi:hypothetical protein